MIITRRALSRAARMLALLAAASLASHSAHAEDAAVNIDNFTFGPKTLTVAVGTTVTWSNRDDIPHTVLSDDDAHTIRSKPMDTNDTFTFTFTKPGTYPYHCSIHPHMQGTIVVQ